jgi:hypothetical protein
MRRYRQIDHDNYSDIAWSDPNQYLSRRYIGLNGHFAQKLNTIQPGR